jgi:hypothetical protein
MPNNEIILRFKVDKQPGLRDLQEIQKAVSGFSGAFKNLGGLSGAGQLSAQLKGISENAKSVSRQLGGLGKSITVSVNASQLKTATDNTKGLTAGLKGITPASSAAANAINHLKKATVGASKEETDARKKAAKVFADAMKEATKEARQSQAAQVQAARAVANDQKKFANEAANAQKRAYAEMTTAAKKSADQQAAAFGKVRGVLGGVGKIALGGAVGVGFLGAGIGVAAAKGILETTVAFEGYNARLLTVFKSQGEVNAKMAELSEFARKTPFELGEVVDAFTRLQAYGLNPTAEQFKILGDFAAGANRSFSDTAEALADALRGEFTRLQEFSVTKDMIAAQGRNIINAKGQIQDYARFQEAIFKLMEERSAGSMGRLADTITGRWSNLKDALGRASLQIGEGLKGPIMTALQAITRAIEDIITPETTTRIADFFERVFSPDNMREFAKTTIRAGLELKAMFQDWYDLLSSIMGAIKEMKGIPTQRATVGAGVPSLFEAPKLDLRGNPRTPPGALPPATVQFDKIANQFATKWIPPTPPMTPGRKFYDDLKGGQYQSPIRNLSAFPPPPKMNAIDPDAARKDEEARKRREQAELARIRAIKDPLQRDIQITRKEFREKKDGVDPETRRNIEVEEAREVAAIYQKYKDDRAQAEEESLQRFETLNQSIEDFEKKRTDLQKTFNEQLEEGKRKEYERMVTVREGMLARNEAAKEEERILSKMAQSARDEADRVKGSDPERRLGLLQQAEEHERQIVALKREQQETTREIADAEYRNATTRAQMIGDETALGDLINERIGLLGDEQQRLGLSVQDQQRRVQIEAEILDLQQQMNGVVERQNQAVKDHADNVQAVADQWRSIVGVAGEAMDRLTAEETRQKNVLNDYREAARRSTLPDIEQRRLALADQIADQVHGMKFADLPRFGPEQMAIQVVVDQTALQEQRERLKSVWSQIGADFKTNFRSSFVGLFEGLYSGGGSALKQFAANLKATLIRSAAEATVEGLSGLMKGAFSGIFGSSQKKEGQIDPAQQAAQLIAPVKSASLELSKSIASMASVFLVGKSKIGTAMTVLAQVLSSIKGGGGGGGGGIFGWISDILGGVGRAIDRAIPGGGNAFETAGRIGGSLLGGNLLGGGGGGGRTPPIQAGGLDGKSTMASAMRMELPDLSSIAKASSAFKLDAPELPRLQWPKLQTPDFSLPTLKMPEVKFNGPIMPTYSPPRVPTFEEPMRAQNNHRQQDSESGIVQNFNTNVHVDRVEKEADITRIADDLGWHNRLASRTAPTRRR